MLSRPFLGGLAALVVGITLALASVTGHVTLVLTISSHDLPDDSQGHPPGLKGRETDDTHSDSLHVQILV